MSANLEKEIFGDSDDEFENADNIMFDSDDDEVPIAVNSSLGSHDNHATKNLARHDHPEPTQDSTSRVATNDEYAERDIPLPSFKRRDGAGTDTTGSVPKPSKKAKSTPRRQRDQEDHDSKPRAAPLSPDSAKRREASDDVDAVMRKLKSKRSKQDLQDEAEVDEIMDSMLNKMRDAALNDQEFNKNKQPAIAKLKLLPSVLELLSRITWFSQFLENNILEGIKLWLEPLTDGSLPSLDIQKGMMDALSKMPIETHHLRHSLVGRIVMFYTKCDRVTPNIRRLADDLIRRWMRPILKRSSNYKDQELQEIRIDPWDIRPIKKQRSTTAAGASAESDQGPKRTRIPQPVAPSFNIVPVSSIAGMATGEKRVDKYRKLKSTMKSIKSRSAK
ncbi:hypothetical protein BASA50_000426 [Batrachochytrium salamandrivorans]|uniref:TFIIS N-terminal domain-containing protein n=1 Tax=Batrachochytrium salamandrivorans TaxID=1357716 RepID=A0ABQ8EWU1_9FUNG|nr:hypothetical protein BASA62_001634 [Batrachochytrium salamandrivorans]KAH6581996.1 hypothetical protein BASA61_008743 [Batrachochytrium salamandrivorans]KAH6586471.1 hypothetical protein BASA50_000426 [Batrachochytrium salamandrivorans]KAJ1345144.1 hypothetical protein BSLG_000659 [Batrachochytrium salamandrivorans]